MSNDRIYVRFKGKTLGPLSEQKVQDLARRGQITRMHDLSFDGISWVKAEEFGEFFHSARSGGGRAAAATAVATATEPDGQMAVMTAAPPVEAPDQGVQWYAHIDGSNRGPLNTAAITAAITSGQMSGETLVWRAGFDDWRPAADSFPQQFAPRHTIQTSPQAVSQELPTPAIATRKGLDGDLYYELQRSRPWALLFGILMLLNGLLQALYCIVFMITGANSQFEGPEKVIGGLIGLAFAAIFVTGGILILRYAESLKDIALRRGERSATEAARRLATVWRFFGISVLTVVGLGVLAVAVFFAMAAGVIDGGS